MMSIVFVVPQSHCVVIERFGRFSRLMKEGVRFRVPILEQIRRLDTWGSFANKGGWLIELTEQQVDTPARQCHTKDNVAVSANASVYWRITDPRRALYEVDVLPQAISDIALNALRANIGLLELDEVLSERQTLNERIAAQLSQTASKWGVLFTRVEIQELTTSKDVSSAMLQQMDAERKRRAVVSEADGRALAELKLAEAEKRSAVMRAEGKAKALGLLAEAELTYLTRLSEAIGPAAATKLLISQKFLDGFDTITRNPANKVFLPNSFNGLLTSPGDPSEAAHPELGGNHLSV